MIYDNYDAHKTANIKFKAEKSCQVDFNVLWRLYSRAFVKCAKWFLNVNSKIPRLTDFAIG
jgi:hypothetical protein